MTPARPPRRPADFPTAGRALVVLAGLLAIGLVALLLTVGGDDTPASPAFDPESRGSSASVQGGQMLGLHPGEPGGAEPSVRTQGEPGLDAPVETRYGFEGRGSIRGEIQVPEGLELPAEYTLVAAPSRVLQGREKARRVERTYPSEERRFVLEDLPLGGYDLTVRAPGLDCRPLPVLLCEGAADPFVVLRLRASGFVDGSVIDEAGRPVEEVLVTLEPRGSGERRETRTGPSGAYLLEDVPDGEYRLLIGPPASPLVEPLELSFRAPSLNVPTRRIPALASFEVATFDENWLPLEGASISGYGSDGGQVDVVTDDTGRAMARHLPPGTYKLAARHPSGRRGKLRFDLTLDGPPFVQLALRP